MSEYLRRITPWRSGLINAYYDNKKEKAEAKETSAIITRWLQDPTSRAKWDGLVGTANWMTEMEKAIGNNDQFAYRNSQLGKLINDVMMLQQLKGTSFYDTMMADIQRASTLDANSDQAQSMIKTMREKGGEEYQGKTDEEIVDKLRSNATKMLATMSQIEQEGRNLDRLVGRIDNDTKQSLIFDKIMRNSFVERRDQMLDEVSTIRSKMKLKGGAWEALSISQKSRRSLCWSMAVWRMHSRQGRR